jgi:hypothetical protein
MSKPQILLNSLDLKNSSLLPLETIIFFYMKTMQQSLASTPPMKLAPPPFLITRLTSHKKLTSEVLGLGERKWSIPQKSSKSISNIPLGARKQLYSNGDGLRDWGR